MCPVRSVTYVSGRSFNTFRGSAFQTTPGLKPALILDALRGAEALPYMVPSHVPAARFWFRTLQRGQAALHQQEIKRHQHQQESVYAEHHRRGEGGNQPS